MAEPIPQIPPVPSQREQYREELAFDEGHDADLPTNEEVPLPIPARESSSQYTNDVDPEKQVDLEGGAERRSSTIKGAAEAEAQPAEPVDPNIVTWDGPDDPANPINWTEKLKWTNIAIIASITFLTYGHTDPPMFIPSLTRLVAHSHPPCSPPASRK